MWSQISAFSNFIAAVAVILSLLYVGRQGKHGRHKYSLEEYGFTAEGVYQRNKSLYGSLRL